MLAHIALQLEAKALQNVCLRFINQNNNQLMKIKSNQLKLGVTFLTDS